jgi:hypothetical protein
MYKYNSNGSGAAAARSFMAALFAITTLAALGILAGTVPAARAADRTCTTVISSGTIDGNLVVPAGANCGLSGTVTVTGDVLVGKGASFGVFAPAGKTVTIGGNVQADQCQSVTFSPGTPPSESVPRL